LYLPETNQLIYKSRDIAWAMVAKEVNQDLLA
jgi:hypothetical protein